MSTGDNEKVQEPSVPRAELGLDPERQRLTLQVMIARKRCKQAATETAQAKAREEILAQRLEKAREPVERANIEAILKCMAVQVEDLQKKQDDSEREHRALSDQLDAVRAAA